MRHEIIVKNYDIDARFYLSEDRGSYVSPHWHDSLELVFMLEGSLEMIYENRSTILKPNEFCIVNSRAVHSVLSSNNRALVLQVPKEMLKKFVPDIDLFYFEVDMNPQKEAEKTRLEKMKKLFRDMYIVYDIHPDGYLLRFNSLLYEMLYMLIHSYSRKIIRSDWNKSKKRLGQLSEITAYIKMHYAEKINVTSLARQFGYNEDYFSRFLKKNIGMSATDYIYAVRIEKVYQDLMNTDQPINQIFEKHGCTNYRVSMRVFKEKYGCTPKERRKQGL